MAIKYNSRCTVCQYSKENPKFRARIYHAAFRRTEGDESLVAIAHDIGFTPKAVYNHSKRHITETPLKSLIVREKKIEGLKAQVHKDLELSFDHDEIVPKENYEEVWDTIIADGLGQLQKADKNLTINQILAATKLKSDFSSKKRGQDVEIIKTMYRSAHATTEPTGMAVPGQEGPGDIRGEVTGDDSTQGSEEILTPSSQEKG